MYTGHATCKRLSHTTCGSADPSSLRIDCWFVADVVGALGPPQPTEYTSTWWLQTRPGSSSVLYQCTKELLISKMMRILQAASPLMVAVAHSFPITATRGPAAADVSAQTEFLHLQLIW